MLIFPCTAYEPYSNACNIYNTLVKYGGYLAENQTRFKENFLILIFSNVNLLFLIFQKKKILKNFSILLILVSKSIKFSIFIDSLYFFSFLRKVFQSFFFGKFFYFFFWYCFWKVSKFYYFAW